MPADQTADRVEVIIGGLAQSAWSHYEIDSDLLTPADEWAVSLDQSDLQVPIEVRRGVLAQIRVGGELVMTGQVDTRSHTVRKGLQGLDLRGRDGAAQLLDCSAPIFAAQELTLEQVVAKIVRPMGITKVRIDADATIARDRVAIEPGETAWGALQRAAEANGLWPWFEPNGTLVVGGPDYSKPIVDTLIVRRDGQGNNVVEASETESLHERYSEVTVLGQSHATAARSGRHDIKATVKDTGVSVYRPRLVIDHEATSSTIAAARARKVISDARVRGYSLSITMRGHRTASGALWTPGQRVRAVIEDLGIDGVFFVMARRFSGLPQMTTLSLREDGAWVLDAHPKTLRRHGKTHKMADQPGRIIDLTSGGAQ
jgi:prophage tail gpP-like protein